MFASEPASLDTHEGYGSSRSVELAASILLELANSDVLVGVRELARRLGVTKTTAHRVLTALERAGFVAVERATQKYELGPGVLTLAAAFVRESDLLALAVPHMERLRRQCGETVALSVIVGDSRITLSQLESFNELRYTSRTGMRQPLHAGAAGQCLLAFADPAMREDLVGRISLDAFTDATIADRGALRRALATIARTGYAATRGERVPGTVGVAAPIFGTKWGVAALSVSGPEQRMSRSAVKRAAPTICEFAGEIGRELAAGRGFLPGDGASA